MIPGLNLSGMGMKLSIGLGLVFGIVAIAARVLLGARVAGESRIRAEAAARALQTARTRHEIEIDSRRLGDAELDDWLRRPGHRRR